MVAKHLKTGNLYDVLYTGVIECTNGREDIEYVVYKRDDKVFCREAKEFYQKFKIINV